MTDPGQPEIGARVDVRGIGTNYLEAGSGPPLLLVHGSGPGVTAYANWRLNIGDLARHFRVLAPDMAGFGFSDKPTAAGYSMARWVDQLVGFLDALGIERASLVGNSFGGGLGIRVAVEHPERLDRLVLMGSMGVSFPITEGLDQVWGYQPGFENMRKILDYFAYSRDLSAMSWPRSGTGPRWRPASRRRSRRCSRLRVSGGWRPCPPPRTRSVPSSMRR